MTTQQPMTMLQRFFAGMAEQTFAVKLGIVDPPLIDYLSTLLVRCVRADQMPLVRASRGHALQELGLLVKAAETRFGIARRRIHRRIGDFTIFWAGLFPEKLQRTKSAADLDCFTHYCRLGRHAYLIASSIPTADETAVPADVLERLGHEFEMCAYGLREVRREWEMAAGVDRDLGLDG